MNPKHFAGLDGLRFISITFVVLHHLFTFKVNFGFSQFDYPVLGVIGFYGIQFFFMGSGFLITYLLLHEHAKYKSISLKHFFLRRILRIWPGYYLLILLFLLVLQMPSFRMPSTTDAYLAADYRTSNIFFLSFLPHIQPFLYPTGPYVHHTYTIGIEEQFYVLWGLLFYFLKRYTYTLFWVMLIGMPLFNFLHQVGYNYVQTNTQAPTAVRLFNSTATFFHYNRFSTFAIGGLFGYAYFFQKSWINVFRNRVVQVLLYVAITLSIMYNVQVPYMEYEYISLLMACLMLTATFRNDSIINYSAKWISYLGKVSYGIYLFHIFAIVLACKIVGAIFPNEHSVLVTLLLCILTMLLSIGFGIVSYHFFEVHFLKLKNRFRRIHVK